MSNTNKAEFLGQLKGERQNNVDVDICLAVRHSITFLFLPT